MSCFHDNYQGKIHIHAELSNYHFSRTKLSDSFMSKYELKIKKSNAKEWTDDFFF